MKRVFTFLISIITVFGFMPATVSAQSYCTPTYTYGCSYGDGLTSFDLNTINETIVCANGYYQDHSAMSTDLTLGNTYVMTLTAGYSSTYFNVWIDFNNDNVFDASESVVTGNCASSGSSYTFNISIPNTASPGPKRFRIRPNWASGTTDPCGNLSYGTAIDYTVNLMPLTDTDAGVTEIITPTALEDEAASVPVEVVFTNFGTLAMTATDVVFSLNGATAVSTSWTGNLLTGESDTITIANITIPAGNNNICAWTELVGDTIPMDDTTCLAFYGNPLWDAGVTAILTPGALEMENASVAPEVTVENFGVNIITSMDIEYTINGGTPTTYAWTGSLAPGTTENVILPAFTVPGGFDTICAYTVLPLDGDATNDETCFDFYADPQFDLAAVDFLNPVAYCGMGMEDITVRYVNQGDTLTSFDMGYSYNGGSAVTETVTQTVLPGDTLTYTFTTQVDMSTTTVDILFAFTVWCDVTGDPLFNNDSLYFEVTSPHVPMDPIVNNDTIVYGTAATFIAFSNDTVLWYDSDTAGAPNIATGNYYTTPVLLDTTNYWAQAIGGAGNMTWTFDTDLEGWTATDACGYGYNWAWADDNGSGTAFAYSPYGNSSQILTSPVVTLGGATEITLSFNHKFNTESCCDKGLVAYRLDGGPWIEFIPTVGPYNGSTELTNESLWSSCGYSATMPRYAGNSNGYMYSEGTIDVTGATSIEIVFEYTSDASVQYDGWWIDDVTIDGIAGCGSNMVPVTAIVTGIPTQDVGIVGITAPVDGIELAMETVTVEVLNYGLDEITNFDVSFVVDGGTAVTETVTDTVQPGNVYVYTFTSLGDLSGIGVHDVLAYTNHPSDIYSFNDSLTVQVESFPLTYCTSSALYTAYTEIVDVELGLWNNYSGPPSGAIYTDFTGITGPGLGAGVTYPITITSDFAPNYTYIYNCYVEVYIDFNHDGIYDETTDELVFGDIISTSGTASGTFTVPLGSVPGNSGMRVVLNYYGSASVNTPCGTYSYGETEDYLTTIAPVIPNDGGVIAIVNPGAFAVENIPESVEVTVRNFGSDTLTAFDVAYEFNGAAPVVTGWTGSLAPNMETNVVLPDVNPIGLTNNLCAYTIVPNDSNTFNDGMCMDFFATPQYEAGVTAIFPESGCGLGMEDIILRIQNYGDTIMGNLLATYIYNGGTPVTEVVIDQILPGDSLDFVFSVPQDFTVTTANDTFNLVGYINLLGDPIQTNDTIASTVISMYTPDPPTVTNDTVQYGDTAVLYADANAALYWYDDPLGSASGNQFISSDTFFVTPVLFDTATYFVEASGAVFNDIQLGTGTTVYSTTAGNPYGQFYTSNQSQFLILASELQALGYAGGEMNSLAMEVITPAGAALQNFSISMGATSLTALSTSDWQTGLQQVYLDPAYTTVTGWNTHIFDTPFVWDGTSNVIIQFCFSNGTSNWTSNASLYYNTPGYTCGLRYYTDGSFTCGTPSSVYTVTQRPNFKFNVLQLGCPSSTIAVQAIVQGIPDYDAGITDISSPVSGIELTNCEDITVTINNWGVNSIANFPVYYSINGGTPIMEMVPYLLNSGDTYIYTFSNCEDLSAFGTYDICAWTGVINDAWSANDTMCVSIDNDSLIFCDSYALYTSYTEIIDVEIGTWNNFSGPAYGATYSNFGSITGPFIGIGNSYPITITSDFAPGYSYIYDCYVEVYIDFNHDGIYDETTDELVFGDVISTSGSVSGTITVPFGSVAANSAMRVVLNRYGNSVTTTPCGTYTYGETEDYLVMIAPPIPHDAGVIEILNPVDNLIENFVSPVEVIVQNFGTDTIFNMNVNYEVNGGAAVSFAYVGSLATGETDTVTLPDLTVPGGFYDFCSYTVLAGDSNTFNDETCLNLYATPQFEAGMLSIDEPVEGCDLGLQDVVVSVANLGDTIVPGNLELSYTMASISTVTEIYPDTVFPFDTISYTFNTQVDLSVTASMEFEIFAWLDLVGDPIQTNDSTSTIVWSGLTPDDPIVDDITIWSGEFGVFNVNNLDSSLIYNWYDVDTNFISSDYSMTTDMLFDTTNYFVEAVTGIAATGFTTAFNSNNGQSGNMFDLTALTGNITIESFDINIDNSVDVEVYYKAGSYIGFETDASAWTLLGSAYCVSNGLNVPSPLAVGGLTIPSGQTYALYITVTTGTGMNYTTLSSPPYYTDGNLLIDNSCGKSYPFGSTFTPRLWNGTIYYGSGACSSALVPIAANVQYADYDAAVWNVTSPTTGSYLGNEDVSAEVYNNGLYAIGNFPISYTVNGGTAVQETFTDSLQPGDMLVYTFATQADLSVFGAYDICVFTGLTNDGLTSNDTSCVSIDNLEGDGLSCMTAYPYTYINDPAVSGATTSSGDVEWWSFELIGDYTNVVVSLCSSGFDTKLDVYEDCSAGSIGYNDDYCGLQSQVNFPAGLSAGTYYAKVYGFGSSYGSYLLTITGDLAAEFIVDETITDVTCNGLCDGAIDLTVTNIVATPPFSFVWSNGETTEDISGLCAGTYTVTVSDSGTATDVVETYTVGEPAELNASLFKTDATTFGGNDGALDLWPLGGTAPLSYMWSNGATTEDISNAYAGYYTVTITDANGCTFTISEMVDSPWPTIPLWTPPTATATTHEIDIPQNALITLDAAAIPYGSLVGVFYNQNGNMVCGGYAYWSGMDQTLIAYGATAGFSNGFNPGDTFVWKVNVPGDDEYDATAVYNTLYTDLDQFVVGGSSAIYEVNALSIQTQTIEMPVAWSIFSTYIIPDSPDITDVLSDIATLCMPSNLIIAKDAFGGIYWPQYCLNTIGDVTIGWGYQVKLTTAATVNISGQAVVPELTPLTLGAGWSLLGYLRQSPGDVTIMLADIATMGSVSDLIIAKDAFGGILWPQYWLNTIGNMLPGRGYQIKMAVSYPGFTYPANSAPTGNSAKYGFINEPTYYDDYAITGNNMTIGIPEDAWTTKPEIGDEIGIFNQEGELIGSSVYQDGFNAITVWGEEILNEAKEDNAKPFSIKLWSYASGLESDIIVENWESGSNMFETNAISIVGKLSLTADANQYALYQNMPNPFNKTTDIKFNIPVAGNVSIYIYNTIGEKLVEVVSHNFEAGEHVVTFDASHLPSGNYFYKMITDNFVATKPMHIRK